MTDEERDPALEGSGSADHDGSPADSRSPARPSGARRAVAARRRPRTGGEVGGMAPVQVALAVLVVFLALLVLWWLWPLLAG